MLENYKNAYRTGTLHNYIELDKKYHEDIKNIVELSDQLQALNDNAKLDADTWYEKFMKTYQTLMQLQINLEKKLGYKRSVEWTHRSEFQNND